MSVSEEIPGCSRGLEASSTIRVHDPLHFNTGFTTRHDDAQLMVSVLLPILCLVMGMKKALYQRIFAASEAFLTKLSAIFMRFLYPEYNYPRTCQQSEDPRFVALRLARLSCRLQPLIRMDSWMLPPLIILDYH